VADAVAVPFTDRSFDFVTAFMSIMDVPHQARAFREVSRVLHPGGFLQFSICHPCFDPPHRRVLREPDGTTRAIELAGYFDATDGRVDTWWFSTLPQEERARVAPFRTPRFHRTLSEWVEIICRAGLVIEQFGEPCASANWPQPCASWKTLESHPSFCTSARENRSNEEKSCRFNFS
jgi:SAM-dependent methyltransferase